jgi:SLOG family YspA-like protein
MIKVIVFGSRNFSNPGIVHAYLDGILSRTGPIQIVHGDCPTGADYWAEVWTITRSQPEPIRFNPLAVPGRSWPSAGPLRNKDMAAAGADWAAGFRSPGKSNGTDGMRRECIQHVIAGELFFKGTWERF